MLELFATGENAREPKRGFDALRQRTLWLCGGAVMHTSAAFAVAQETALGRWSDVTC
jgi:hypothetical protein